MPGNLILADAQAIVPLSHQAWSTEDGLPDASVHQILQTRDAYLWIATENGAARFDGSEFKVLRHGTQPAFASDDISALAQDSSGDLWFGTADGLIRMHGDSFQRFGEQEGLPASRVIALAATADNNLLVLTAGGLVRWTGNSFDKVPLRQGRVIALNGGPDGSFFLLMEDRRVLIYARDGVVQALEPATPEHLLGLVASGSGSLWAYSPHELTALGPTSQRSRTVGRDLPGSRILTVQFSRNGIAWIGTNRGLFALPAVPGLQVQSIEALRGDSVQAVMEDRENNLWIGTESSGLHVLRPRKFRSDTTSAGEAVSAVVAAPDGTVWFGTRDSGIHRIRHGVADQPVPPAELTSPVVLSLAAGNHDDLWVGTPDGLNHVTGSAVRKFTSADGLPDDFVRSLLVDTHGILWAATRGGLARVENDRVTLRTEADGLGSDSIGPLIQMQSTRAERVNSGDDLWIGTSGGLSHLRGGHIETFAPQLDGQRAIITAMAQSAEGELLVAVHGAGLLFFAEGRFHPVPLKQAPSEITSLFIDPEGYLWIRGLHGLYRSSIAKLRECAETALRCTATLDAFNTVDGLPNEASAAEGSPQLAQAPDGLLWIATRKGLAIADPLHLPVNHVPPSVVIQHFAVDGVDQPLPTKEIQVAAGHSRYSFSFAALSYTLPAKVRYRYKLNGLDRDWVDAGAAHTAYYTSLPPKHYRFEVQAQNNDGVWDNGAATLSFRVLPPFYRRWWFFALALLLTGGLVLLIIRLRERVVQRRFALVLQERNRMAREIHDTLAQDFVSVSLQLDIASSLLKRQQPDQALAQLQSTRTLVKDGLQAARQSIWNLRATGGEDSLPARLSALVTRYSIGGKAPRLSIGGTFRKLSVTLEAEVLRIAQESLSNAERHAEATEVSVALFYRPDKLELTIRDNGEGFSLSEAEQLEGHYGLRGVRERAASLGGELMIASSPGEGTAVSLIVPLGKESDRP